MDATPLVSIISPSLNQGAFVERMMLSVRSQEYPNIEHIVVDGGSEDATLEILSRFAKTHDLRWISEPDTGMYDAVNKGLRLATGEILTYLNTDDLHFPWTVSAVVDTFFRHPNADLVYGDMVSRDLESGRDTPFFFPRHFNVERHVRSGWLGQPTVFFRQRLLDTVGLFDDGLDLLADSDYWIRVGRTCEVVKCEEFLAVQTNHAATKRHRQSREFAEEGHLLKKRHGAPVGISLSLWQLLDRTTSRVAYTNRMISLALRVLAHRATGSKLPTTSPWSRTINSSSLEIVSWSAITAALLPWAGRRYRSRFCRFR